MPQIDSKSDFCHLLLCQLAVRFAGRPELALDWFVRFTPPLPPLSEGQPPLTWAGFVLNTVDRSFGKNATSILRRLEQSVDTEHDWAAAIARTREKRLLNDGDLLRGSVCEVIGRRTSAKNIRFVSDRILSATA